MAPKSTNIFIFDDINVADPNQDQSQDQHQGQGQGQLQGQFSAQGQGQHQSSESENWNGNGNGNLNGNGNGNLSLNGNLNGNGNWNENTNTTTNTSESSSTASSTSTNTSTTRVNVDVGLDLRVIIALGAQQLGQQFDVGADAAVDLRRVGALALLLDQRRLLVIGLANLGLGLDGVDAGQRHPILPRRASVLEKDRLGQGLFGLFGSKLGKLLGLVNDRIGLAEVGPFDAKIGHRVERRRRIDVRARAWRRGRRLLGERRRGQGKPRSRRRHPARGSPPSCPHGHGGEPSHAP